MKISGSLSRGWTNILTMMTRKLFMSLLLTLAMVLSTMGPVGVSASEPMDCAGMMAGMDSKSAPDAPKAPSCIDKAGCLLFCAKLPAPTSVVFGSTWSKSSFATADAGGMNSVDTKPDHSPPKLIA